MDLHVGTDYMAAYREWLPLAGQGDARAQTNLGHLYRMGRGVVQNYTTALEWYRMAANQNNARAQANLANMYLKGLGITADPAALTAASAPTQAPLSSTNDALPSPPLSGPAVAPRPAPALPSTISPPALSAARRPSAR